MRLHPTVRRSLLAVVTALTLAPLALASPAAAADTVKPIVFPVDGKVTYTDTFGACRDGCTRTHEGQDLMGKKMMPLLAAVTGTVHRVKFDNATGNSVVIKGTDGWTYHYLHVNNDTPGTDDGRATRAQAFPSWVQVGAAVSRGQVIAYLGDSGNAESTAPHLHFEIRMPPVSGSYTGEAINPYESLKRALVWSTTSSWELRRTATPGPADEAFSYGVLQGDRGLLCDWDGDGTDEAVVFRSGTWFLRAGTSTGTNAAQLTFGSAGDIPLCGDLDDDPADEPVLFRNGIWTLRPGFAPGDTTVWKARYGIATGDQPVLGDWDGDGRDDLGFTRAGTWYVRTSGGPTGTTAANFAYGREPGDQPVAGDWDGDGDDDAGIFRHGTWFLRSTATVTGSTATSFDFGASSGHPLVGYGVDPVKPGVGTFRPRTA